MAARSVTLVNNKTIPVGQSISNTIDIPATSRVRSVNFALDATNYVPGTAFGVDIQIDAGEGFATVFSFGVTSRGFMMDGVTPATEWSATATFNPLPDCQARAVINVTGNPLKTTGTATVQ